MWGSVRLFGGHEISVTSRLRPVWFPSAWKTILAWIICASNTFMYTNFSPDDLYGLLSILSGLILSKSKLKVAVLSSRFSSSRQCGCRHLLGGVRNKPVQVSWRYGDADR